VNQDLKVNERMLEADRLSGGGLGSVNVVRPAGAQRVGAEEDEQGRCRRVSDDVT
jgi:hypothetical protein